MFANPWRPGFTLIELLIAMVLLGLIVTLLFGGLRLGDRSWNSTDHTAERNSEMRLVWRFLGDRFGQARRVNTRTSAGDQVLFAGTEEAVEFVTPLPVHMGIGGLYLVRLQQVSSDGRQQLILTRWLNHPEVLEGEGGVPEWSPLESGAGDYPAEGDEGVRAYYSRSVLVEDLESMELAYFGQGDGENEPDWKNEWQEKRLMPLLVRLRITDREGSWPEMAFRLPN